MSEGDERRPSWLPLAVLAVVVAGIIAVSMVGGSLTHQDDRGATPSIPIAQTSTTTLLSSASPTSTTIPTTIRLEPVSTSNPLSTSIGTIQFTTWRIPQEDFFSLNATPHGVVAIQDPRRLVWSDDGITWSEVPISVKPYRSAIDGGFAIDGDDLIMYGYDGAVRLTWSGTRWVEQERLLGIDRVYQLVVGPHGVVAIRGDQLFYSADGTEFHLAEQPPNRDTLQDVTESGCSPETAVGEGIVAGLEPLVATNEGFIALTPRHITGPNFPACGPLVWFSTDGNTWEPVPEESPFGRRAYVHDIVARDGRLVATGQVTGQGSAIWVSDDGLSWEPVDVQRFDYAEKIAAGARGWILLGATDEPGTRNGQMWFSTDGTDWDGPYPQPYGWLAAWFTDAAVLDDRIIGRGDYIVVGEFLDN